MHSFGILTTPRSQGILTMLGSLRHSVRTAPSGSLQCYCYEHGNAVYHDAIVDEAPSVPCRLQVWILFRAGHPDVPHLLPGLVELHVHRVHPGVVRGHRVAHARRDAVLLQCTRGMGRVRNIQNCPPHVIIQSFFPAHSGTGEVAGLRLVPIVAQTKNGGEEEGTGITVW